MNCFVFEGLEFVVIVVMFGCLVLVIVILSVLFCLVVVDCWGVLVKIFSVCFIDILVLKVKWWVKFFWFFVVLVVIMVL